MDRQHIKNLTSQKILVTMTTRKMDRIVQVDFEKASIRGVECMLPKLTNEL